LQSLRARQKSQPNEADIRVVPEPGLVMVLVAGVVLLAILNINR
jgi:hypothetical protein